MSFWVHCHRRIQEMDEQHPGTCFTALRPTWRSPQLVEKNALRLRLHPLVIAMALLSSVSAASSCLARAALWPVAQRNGGCNESEVVSIAASSGRVQHGAACLAASSSTQLFGSRELAWQCSLASRKQARRVHALGIRCERTTEGGNRRSLDTWIGRAAMLGFVAAIGVEISTGKGVLESAGLPTPAPPLVLGLIALAGSVTAFGVFRSTARD